MFPRPTVRFVLICRFDTDTTRGPVYSRQASLCLEKDGPVIAVRRCRRRPWRVLYVRRCRRRPWRVLYVRQINFFARCGTEPISPVSTFLKLKSYGTAMGKIHGVSLARISDAIIEIGRAH